MSDEPPADPIAAESSRKVSHLVGILILAVGVFVWARLTAPDRETEYGELTFFIYSLALTAFWFGFVAAGPAALAGFMRKTVREKLGFWGASGVCGTIGLAIVVAIDLPIPSMGIVEQDQWIRYLVLVAGLIAAAFAGVLYARLTQPSSKVNFITAVLSCYFYTVVVAFAGLVVTAKYVITNFPWPTF